MPKPSPRVLLVERGGAPARSLEAALAAAGFRVLRASPRGVPPAGAEFADAMVAALDAPSAIEILRTAHERDPELRPVVILPRGDGAAALDALRAGAAFAHERPVDVDAVVESVRRALSQRAMLTRLDALEAEVRGRAGLVARSRPMLRLVEQLERLAPARGPVLLEGEPGTGKRRVARALHARGARRTAPFVAVDCGGPALESALFGDGSETPRATGAIERAEGGTLYLERIGEAPPAIQVQLLRVLHDRAWERPGGGDVRADVRLVVSTDRDLAADADAGRFRRDLLDRLSVARLRVPPLRERGEDLPLLVRDFLARGRARKSSGITPGALDRLLAHPWPGNVRELERTVEAMAALAGGRTPGVDDLPAHLRPERAGALEFQPGMTVEEAERALIAATLRHTGGDKAKAAALLGIGLRTLYRKLGDSGPVRR